MYKSSKFWILATICFAIFTVLYAINNGMVSFVTILNAILFLVSFINMTLLLKTSKKVKDRK